MDHRLPSLADVVRLRRAPDKGARLTLAEKLGLSYAARLFKPKEREIADDIVRAVALDIEVEVRQALARTIASSPDLPHDVALRLAYDVIEVAEPILRESDLLGDDALVAIVQSRSEAHRAAIAARQLVSEPVSAAIIEHGETPSVSTLAGNAGASISEPSLGLAIDRFGETAAVTEPLAERAALPLAIAERLVLLVSDRLKVRFAKSGAKADRYAQGLAAQIAEGAAFILGGGESDTLDLLALLDQLKASGRLQPSLVLKAGRAGEKELMLAAVSRLTGQKYSAIAGAFGEPGAARQLLQSIGLVPSEIDELVARAAA